MSKYIIFAIWFVFFLLGYENILADPAKIMKNVLLPNESIN